MIGEDSLRVWTVSADRPGLLARCVGVAQFIDPRPRRIVVRHAAAFWRKARFSAKRDFKSPPEIVIACDKLAASHVRRIAAACVPRPLTIHLGLPPEGSRRLFDLAFVPRHEWNEAASDNPSCRPMVGVTHEVTAEMLARLRPAARARWVPAGNKAIAVQINTGGGAYVLDEPAVARLVAAIRSLIGEGWSVLLQAAAGLPAELRQHLSGSDAGRVTLWDGSGENPYRDFLAAADAHLIAKGSIALCCEALASGRPVFLFDLPPGKRAGFAEAERFYRDICESLRLARPFEGAIHDYAYTPLAEAERLAGAILSEIETARPELIPAADDPARIARKAAVAAAHRQRQLSRGHVLPGYEEAYRAHHGWLAAQGLLGRPWFVLGAAPDPAIPADLPADAAYVYIRFSGKSARRHGLPVGDLTLLPRWKEAQRSSGLDFKAILRIRDTPTIRERFRRSLRRFGRREAEISTAERDDYVIGTLGSLFPKVEKRPSNGVALVCFALAHGVENVIIAGVSFESEGHEYEASKRPRRHVDEDRAALRRLAELFPGVTTTEESLLRATGIPLFRAQADEPN